MIIGNEIECYVSKGENEKTTYFPFMAKYGVIRFDIGETAIVFKSEDIEHILGGMKEG